MLHPMPKAPKPNAAHPAKGQRVGYVRVSTFDENEGRQLVGVERDRTFTDKASGKDVKRPQLEAMLAFVREGACREEAARRIRRGK